MRGITNNYPFVTVGSMQLEVSIRGRPVFVGARRTGCIRGSRFEKCDVSSVTVTDRVTVKFANFLGKPQM